MELYVELAREKGRLTWAPTSLHSDAESWVAATPIVTVFLCSVERRFSLKLWSLQQTRSGSLVVSVNVCKMVIADTQ